MSIQETAPLTISEESQAAIDGRFFNPEVVLSTLRLQVHNSQEPFEALGRLNPDSDWTSEATAWSKIAQDRLDAGAQLEVTFSKRFGYNLLVAAGVALLNDNEVMRHPSGLSRLYVPGEKVSHLRARAYSETHRELGGKRTTSQHRIVDAQIVTAIDMPTTIFDISQLQHGESKVRYIPPNGSWFSFPLGEVTLALV